MSYQVVDAGEGGKLSGTCRDADGDAIAKADVSAITLTVTDAASGSVVNSRNAQNVLDANDGTMDATSGAFAFNIQPEDTALVDATADSEEHVFKFRVVGTFAGEALEFEHRVRCVETLLLCRFDQVKLQLAELDEDHEALVVDQIEAFTKLVENLTGRTLRRKTTTTEVLSPEPGAWAVRVSRWPIHSITSVKEDLSGDFTGTALDAESYVNVCEGVIRRRWVPFLGGPGSVQVVYDGGFGAAPGDLRRAAIEQVVHAWTNRSAVHEIDLLPNVKRAIEQYKSRMLL